MEFNFNWKYKEFEIRKTENPSSGIAYWELVKWQHIRGKDSCFTLASFHKGSEDWELKFCGNRPFEHIDEEDLMVIWRMLKMTCNALNDYYTIERKLMR